MLSLRAKTMLTGLLATPLLALAQGAPASAPAPEIAAVQQADAAYWKAYNECDYATLDKLTAKDVEFYHDLGGVTLGREKLTDSVRRNICGNPQAKVRREPVAASVRTSLLKDHDKVYGVIMTGEHVFYQNAATKPGGQARFTQLWLREGSGWQLKRVLSYDHGPMPDTNERKTATLTSAELDRVAGTYNAKLQPQFNVARAGDALSIGVNGKPMMFYPLDKNTFFAKEQDITIEFKPATGTPQSFLVMMNGAPIDEPKRQ